MICKISTYNNIRANFGKLTPKQVQGFEAIFNEWDNNPLEYIDTRQLAYILATSWHETAKTMQPIKEYGRGRERPYGKKIKHSGLRYLIPLHIFYGRGFVQLTWYENYLMMGRLLGLDLLNNPDMALQMDVAVKIMFEGMFKGSSSFGDFTGKCLEMYFNKTTNNPLGARKIINGTDQAKLIESYHNIFAKSIIKIKQTC